MTSTPIRFIRSLTLFILLFAACGNAVDNTDVIRADAYINTYWDSQPM
ncbi:MAG: hypothetical protein MUP11_13515 [Anaerolineales bacterium]|nr:hypothetical protein [Anaerolineales bacterium]